MEILMEWLWDTGWERMLVPSASLVEIFVRGTVVYLVLYTLLRLIHKRQRGGVGMTDLLVIVLIADASQNAMADDFQSVPDGILLVGTIIGWSAALDWLGYRSPVVERFTRPGPLTLVEDGQLVRKNMKRELITESELMSQLRLQGITTLDEVVKASLEGDGQISVQRKEEGQEPPRRRQQI